MSDLETLLRTSLDAAADHAPNSGNLLAGARRRLRRRRVLATSVVVAAVAMAVVPISLALGDGGVDRSKLPVATDSPSVASGWRIESWRDIEVTVPDTWGHDSLDQWCVGGGDPAEVGVVQRPEGGQTDVLCSPVSGYGLKFGDPADVDTKHDPGEIWQYGGGDAYPDGAWLASWSPGSGSEAAISVVTPDRATARRIIDSAHRFSDFDANGCPPHADADPATDKRLAVCRYGGDGWLQQSELLSTQDSERAIAEIGHGALIDGSVGCGSSEDTTIKLGGLAVLTLTAECAEGNQIALSGTLHQLTARDLYWALSPGWSGGVDGSVPFPDHLRR
ncbi:MAG: hypothetical protein QM714_09105 [Nocardioides sp.]|uniref:hypothetical protein n=1 Tax=Nocardioides sp. TaxID=35761 RepID=UPI0039E671F3